MSGYVSLDVHPMVMHGGFEHLAPQLRLASPRLPVHSQHVEAVKFLGGEVTFTERATDCLTHRQGQIAALAISGLSNSAMAHAMFLDEDTIKTHLRSIHRAVGTQKEPSGAGVPTSRRAGILNTMLTGKEPFAEVAHPSVLPAGVFFSEREWQVVAGVMRGGTNADVARSLGLETLTIKSHLGRISSRLGTGNRELIAFVGATSEEITNAVKQNATEQPDPLVLWTGAVDPRRWYT